MQHLVTPQEVVKLGRPIGKVDTEKLLAYISETEQLNIKPVIGTKLFLDLLDQKEDRDPRFDTLLNGGTYEDERDGIMSFVGLKVTISYFVYAQNVMSGDFQSTRYGMVMKDGEFSNHISSKERSDCYNNTLEVANAYLRDCVAYCKSVGLISSAGKATAFTGGIRIRRIGN